MDDGFRKDLYQVLQDPGLEGPEVASDDEVAGDDHEQDEQQQPEEREDPDLDGGPAFSGESLTNGVEGGVAGLFIVEEGEPIGGAGFLFVSEGDLVELPFIMLDDIIKLEGDVGDDKVIG